MPSKVKGLIAAPHTPMDAEGQLNLTLVERQAAHLARSGVVGAFVSGSTGEGVSLTCDERIGLAERWMSVTRGTGLQVIVQISGTCLAEIETLGAHANGIQADAIAALAPFRQLCRELESAQLMDYIRPA